jgi:spore maturation protein B
MKFILFLSDCIIPLLVFVIVGSGLMRRRRVYEDFLDGAKRGVRTVVEIMPTLIGLMVAVGILRASGFLDFVSELLGKVLSFAHFPAELVPLAIVKLFSSSAATGLLLDLYKAHGTDSMISLAASIMLSSTETVFYTMSIYFMSVKVKKTRYTLAGALLASLAGIIASILLAGMLI